MRSAETAESESLGQQIITVSKRLFVRAKKGSMAERNIPADPEVAELESLASLLDTQFGIPGTRFRVGLDGLLGLIPGLGDGAGALLSLYIVVKAGSLGAPASLLLRMLINVALDTIVGSVPVAGDLFDFFFKSNRRNVLLLKRHLENTTRANMRRSL